MLNNNLKLLDCDEKQRVHYEKLHQGAIEICKEHGLVFDLATSDINIFIEGTSNKKLVENIARCYRIDTKISKEANNIWCIY